MTRDAFPPPSATRAEVDAWCTAHWVEPDHAPCDLCPACGERMASWRDSLCEPCGSGREVSP